MLMLLMLLMLLTMMRLRKIVMMMRNELVLEKLHVLVCRLDTSVETCTELQTLQTFHQLVHQLLQQRRVVAEV